MRNGKKIDTSEKLVSEAQTTHSLFLFFSRLPNAYYTETGFVARPLTSALIKIFQTFKKIIQVLLPVLSNETLKNNLKKLLVYSGMLKLNG
jgi:hypothetical protein